MRHIRRIQREQGLPVQLAISGLNPRAVGIMAHHCRDRLLVLHPAGDAFICACCGGLLAFDALAQRLVTQLVEAALACRGVRRGHGAERHEEGAEARLLELALAQASEEALPVTAEVTVHASCGHTVAADLRGEGLLDAVVRRHVHPI